MKDLAEFLDGPRPAVDLSLCFADVPIRVLTNDAGIADRLAEYYAPYLDEAGAPPVAEVRLLQGEPIPLHGFTDVRRGGGKLIKEAVLDVPGWRLVRKRLTGVLMAVGAGRAVALGDLTRHLNQAINLINASYARAVIRRGYVLLHASAVTWAGQAVALAGPSGAGKSTAALRLVEAGFRFLSNDRVMARIEREGVHALGYPKQPRVNPGSLLHHPRLVTLLPGAEAGRLRGMAAEDLWALEDKRDVDLDGVYGKGTVELSATLRALVLIKWRLGGEAFGLRRLAAAEALANVPLFGKDLGVFDADHPVRPERAVERFGDYAAILDRLAVVEVTGRPDFEALVDLVGDLLAK